MDTKCKLCDKDIMPLYTVNEIPYYLCQSCNLLQNFYWESHHDPQELEHINATTRDKKWPPGEAAHMRQKGWEMLELMYWPVAWKSRILNTALKKIPGYQQFIRRYIKSQLTRVLDFGCGHGIIVHELRKKDHIDIIGLDPYSPPESTWVIHKTLEQSDILENSLSGIFSIETMEHIPNILDTFRALYDLLAPGGVLLVQTHRLEDPEYIRDKNKWFYLEDPKTHITIYSEKAMRRIAAMTGFSSVSFRGVKFARFVK